MRAPLRSLENDLQQMQSTPSSKPHSRLPAIVDVSDTTVSLHTTILHVSLITVFQVYLAILTVFLAVFNPPLILINRWMTQTNKAIKKASGPSIL